MINEILFATIIAGTPLVFTGLGELITEKSGVLNLGAEGMMSMGAVIAFIVTLETGNPYLGIIGGALAGAGMSLIFAFFAFNLLANQVASGLALAILGVGLSAFIGKPYESKTLDYSPGLEVPFLSELPFIGKALFSQQPIVYFSWFALAAIIFFMYRTKAGLTLRAIGESPKVAHEIGYSVMKYRYCATLFGGAMAGIGGAFMSVFYTPLWVEGMVAGRGWIALALVVFSTWKPVRLLFGAYLFGGVLILQLFFQSSDLDVSLPSQFLSALPYLATIFVLILISRNRLMVKLNSPLSLGKPFRADQ